MVTERTLTIEEYDDDSELSPNRNAQEQVEPPPEYDAATAITPLVNVKEAVRKLFVPDYLPDGFVVID